MTEAMIIQIIIGGIILGSTAVCFYLLGFKNGVNKTFDYIERHLRENESGDS